MRDTSAHTPLAYEYPGLSDRTGFLERGLSIFDSQLKEKRYNWAANLTVPFNAGAYAQKIKFGFAGAFRDAKFTSLGLAANRIPSAGDTWFFGLADYELMDVKNFEDRKLYYYPVVNADDYSGTQHLNAGYAMLDTRFLKNFRFVGGLRLERNVMRVKDMIVDSTYTKVDWLPSGSLIYSLNSNMNIRAAFSRTLSRPDFRERTNFHYFDFRDRTTIYGFNGLKDSHITNADLRYEWYPSPGEVVSVSAFYKRFKDPVELTAQTGSSGLVLQYVNLESSTSKGIEIDFRKTFGFINPASKFLSNLYLSGNASIMKSDVVLFSGGGREVKLGDSTVFIPALRNRPLQGLSPYTVNGAIGYSGKPFGLQVSYNRYGKRIYAGGQYPYQDQYEHPRDVIDLQLSSRLLKDKLDIRFNVSDLLQQSRIIYDNYPASGGIAGDLTLENVNHDPKGTGYNKDLDYTRYRSFWGRNFSLNITYNF